jgi:hypothetical protein
VICLNKKKTILISTEEVPLRELDGSLALCELLSNALPGQDTSGLATSLLMKKDKCNELGVSRKFQMTVISHFMSVST